MDSHQGRHRHFGRGMELPSELEKIVPSEYMDKIKSIVMDGTIGRHERRDRIAEVLDTLPDDVKSSLPPPVIPHRIQRMPEEIQSRFLAIQNDYSLNFRKKREKYKKELDQLPEEFREEMRDKRCRSRCRSKGKCGKKMEKEERNREKEREESSLF